MILHDYDAEKKLTLDVPDPVNTYAQVRTVNKKKATLPIGRHRFMFYQKLLLELLLIVKLFEVIGYSTQERTA